MANPYHTPIDEQSGKSYTDVISEEEDTTGADYSGDGGSGGSDPGGSTSDTSTRKLRNDAESDPVNPQTEQTDIQNDYEAPPAYGPEAGNPNDTNDSGRIDSGESATQTQSSDSPAPTENSASGGGSSGSGGGGSDYQAPPAYGPAAGDPRDINGSGTIDNNETSATEPISNDMTGSGGGQNQDPTSWERITRAEEMANNKYPNAESVVVTGAGGGAVNAKVVSDSGRVFTRTFFGGGSGAYPQNEFVDEAYRKAEDEFPDATGVDVTAQKEGGVAADITLENGKTVSKTYYEDGDPGWNFNRPETKRRIASDFSSQLGADVTGDDVSLSRTENGGYEATLDDGAQREIATEKLQQRLDDKLGWNVGREDFTVVETDEGYSAELSAEGIQQLNARRQPSEGRFGVGSAVAPGAGGTNQEATRPAEQFGDIVIRDPRNGKRIEDELREASDTYNRNVETMVGDNSGGPLQIGTEIRQGASKDLNPYEISLAVKEAGEFAITQPGRLIDVGSEAEPGLSGDKRAIGAAGGGAQLVSELDRRGIVEVNRAETRDFTKDLQSRGSLVYESASEQLRSNPTEAVGEFIGGAAVGVAVGTAASRAAPAIGSDVSGEAAVKASQAARRIGGKTDAVVDDVVEVGARAPDVKVTRDPEAGLVDVSPELKSQVREALPSKPSTPEVDARALGRRSRAAEIRTRVGVANRATGARRRFESVAKATPTNAREVAGTLERAKSRQSTRVTDLKVRAKGELMQAKARARDGEIALREKGELAKARQHARAGELKLKTRGELMQARQRVSDIESPSLSRPDFNAPSARKLGRAERGLEIRAARGSSNLIEQGKATIPELPDAPSVVEVNPREIGRKTRLTEVRLQTEGSAAVSRGGERLGSLRSRAPTSTREFSDMNTRFASRSAARISDIRSRAELAARTASVPDAPSLPDISGARDLTIRIDPIRPKRTDLSIGESDLGDLDLTESPLGKFDEGGNLENPAAGSDIDLAQDTGGSQKTLIKQRQEPDTGVGVEKVPGTDTFGTGGGRDLPLLGGIAGASLRSETSPVADRAAVQSPVLAPVQQPSIDSAERQPIDVGVELGVPQKVGPGDMAGPQAGPAIREDTQYAEPLRLDLEERADTRQEATATLVPGGGVGAPLGLGGKPNSKNKRDTRRGVDNRAKVLERELRNPFTGE